MMLYIASDNPLPLIEWRKDDPAFNVTGLIETDIPVKSRFNKPFVVFAGAHTGCSCGFTYGDLPIEDQDDEVEERQSRESVRMLAQYLSKHLGDGTLEIFSCWDGDQSEPAEERLTVPIDFFGGETFSFGEKQFLVITDQ